MVSASCSSTVCIAVGEYDDINSQRQPLLALSQNNGTSWTFPLATSQPTVTPAYDRLGTYSSASCNGNTCIAGGHYFDATQQQRPLIAQSTDNGVTWTFPTSITQPLLKPAHGIHDGAFSAASANASFLSPALRVLQQN